MAPMKTLQQTTQGPLRDIDELLVGARRKHFEERRKNHVPRFLFRAWYDGSGGGQQVSINNTDMIGPPAFVHRQGHEFYGMNETHLLRMTEAHYHGDKKYLYRNTYHLSEFSSWAASLHLVLSYASYMSGKGDRKNIHVAIMDTRQLEGSQEVLVWHVPDLMQNNNNHEYLAHGCVYGRGYQAVSLEHLQRTGLDSIFTWSKDERDHFGFDSRACTFSGPPMTVTRNDLETIQCLSALFNHLAIPVAVALLSLQPRSWRKLPGQARGHLTEIDMQIILKGLGNPDLQPDSLSERWISGTNMVNTKGFPDVQQWIDLLFALVGYTNGRGARQRRRYAESEVDDMKG